MPKKIAVISYNLGTDDSLAIQSALNSAGYNAILIHQWSLNEPDATQFKRASFWRTFYGIVICHFYHAWNLREIILSKRPVICVNSSYVDDLGLGESSLEHVSENSFNLINNSHPITTGLPVGVFNIGSPVWLDSVSSFNHHVDVLVNTLGNNPVLLAHKTHKISYFGWYRMSQASATSEVTDLLIRTANWTFA